MRHPSKTDGSSYARYSICPSRIKRPQTYTGGWSWGNVGGHSRGRIEHSSSCMCDYRSPYDHIPPVTKKLTQLTRDMFAGYLFQFRRVGGQTPELGMGGLAIVVENK